MRHRNRVERAIARDFGLATRVIVRDLRSIRRMASALPDTWRNDATVRTDVLFLGGAIDDPKILERIAVNPRVDNVAYVRGALLWNLRRAEVNKSHLRKLIGTDVYREMPFATPLPCDDSIS